MRCRPRRLGPSAAPRSWYELEYLLVRAGFGIVTLYGDYDRSLFADGSPAMIVVAEPMGG